MFDAETGEQAGVIREGDRILRKQSAEHLLDTIEILENEPFVKTYLKPMFHVAKCLSGPEVQFLHYLLPYLSYESGMLKHSNGKPVTRAYMAEEIGTSTRTIDRMIKKLKEKQILSRNTVGKESQYFLNPYLFMRGKRVNKTLVDMFRNTRWAKLYE